MYPLKSQLNFSFPIQGDNQIDEKTDSNIREIWMFNHHACSPTVPGGTRHFDLGKKLVEKGYNVKIFASSFIHNLNKEMINYGRDNITFENIDGVDFIWLKT